MKSSFITIEELQNTITTNEGIRQWSITAGPNQYPAVPNAGKKKILNDSNNPIGVVCLTEQETKKGAPHLTKLERDTQVIPTATVA